MKHTEAFGSPFRLLLVWRGRPRAKATGGGVAIAKIMAKRIENEENLKRYLERMKELEGQLVPSPDLPTEQLMIHLAKEGEALLAAEAKLPPKKVVGKIVPKKDESSRLSNTLAASSKNPYIRARQQVLMKYPEWRRKEIATIEKNGDFDNKHYQDFVKEVAALGDKLSNI